MRDGLSREIDRLRTEARRTVPGGPPAGFGRYPYDGRLPLNRGWGPNDPLSYTLTVTGGRKSARRSLLSRLWARLGGRS